MLKSESMGWPIRAGWMFLIGTQFLPVWVSSYAVVILLLLILWQWKSNHWQDLGRNTWFKILLAYFGWQLLSLLWTRNFTDAGSNLGTQLLLVLIPALLFVRKPDQNDLRWLFKTQLIASLLAVVVAFLYSFWRAYHAPIDDEESFSFYFFYTELAKPIMHPGYFSLQLIVSLAILTQFIKEKYWRLNVWTVTTALLLLTCLIMLSGRMTQLALILTLAVAQVYQAISKKQWKPILILTGILGLFVIVFQFLPQRISKRMLIVTESFEYDLTTFESDDYNGITVRLALWECAGEIIQENLWLGTGAGDGKDEIRAVYTKKDFQTGLADQLNSHNQFVEAMLYGGVVQAFLLLALFIYGIRRGLTQNQPLFAAFLLLILLCLQTETVLFWHRGVLFFAIFSSLFYLYSDRQKVLPNH